MIQIKNTRVQNTANLIARAIRIAEYYGFLPLEAALAHGKRALPPQNKNSEPQFARRDEKPLLQSARMCLTTNRAPNESMLLWRVAKHAPGTRAPLSCMTLELHCIGTSSAIAEALLIIVLNAIADEVGLTKRTLAINSIGSLESSNRYVRDVGHFLRKHIDSISPTLRPRIVNDPLGTLVQLFEKGHPAMPRAPQSVDYLTEEERRRFWDLLEYLEISGVPYELSPSVLGSRDFWSHTLFELSHVDDESGSRVPFAVGGRYDPLASRLMGAHTPAVVATVLCEVRGKNKVQPIKKSVPALYFAHLGPEARRKALPVLETLRRAGIPVEQSLMYERLHEQMERAKRMSVSHMLIMGHKEAIEGTVLVREVATNSQEVIPVPELTSYLRRQRVYA
ncbi:MAG TPA: His/Gly/Thr/Pro-type tRNA ligase C-terminal domain-containing protein [Candidatus Paceibacterota bacterium]|nr:His/Gly/Thr/Pro-type tRNA ligase C-terminal domain-containing protein [Candidatus Paceibacterota bacterium]